MTAIGILVLRTTLVLLAGLALAELARRRQAALRHALLVATVLGTAALPALTIVTPVWVPLWEAGAPPAVEPDPPGIVTVASTAAVPGPAASATSGFRPSALQVVAGAWVLIGAVALGRLARGVRRLSALARGSRPLADARWNRLLASTTAQMGVRRPVAIRIGADDAPIVTWGLRRPQILLPADAPAWPDARAHHVLAHELAHVARGDWAWHLALEAAGAVYAWHPLMAYVIGRARREAERACDDAVLACGAQASAYASTLLDVARSRRACAASAAVAMADTSSLERRITAMLDTTLDHSHAPRSARAFAAAAVLAFTAAVAGLGAQAQADGLVTGTVLPGGGTPLADITVTFTGPSTVRTVTDAQGHFTVSLPGGAYRAEIRSPGFKPFAARVDVAPGETITRDFALALGTVRESISIWGGPVVEPDKPFVRQAPPRTDPFPGSLEPPKKVKDVKPIYPDALREAGTGGTVVLNARIGVDGFITDLQVQSSPHDALSAAAIAAVEQWKYAPTVLQGKPVPTEMTVTVDFAAK